MSEAESIRPRPRRGMKGSSEGSEPFWVTAGRLAATVVPLVSLKL